MTCESCSFETERLVVHEWHGRPHSAGNDDDLPQIVASILTEPVTQALPAAWRSQGAYTTRDARRWIGERDAEGPTLLVTERATRAAVGLVILFEVDAEQGAGVDIRLGYLLAEQAWGRGLASELIGGFVRWCRAHPEVRSVTGGVDKSNPASARVLEKNGFAPVDESPSSADSVIYRLPL